MSNIKEECLELENYRKTVINRIEKNKEERSKLEELQREEFLESNKTILTGDLNLINITVSALEKTKEDIDLYIEGLADDERDR